MSNPKRSFHDEPREAIVRRRLVTVPRSFAVAVGLTLALPLLIAMAIVVDTVRWAARHMPFVAVRLVVFAWMYSIIEIIGLMWMFAVWVTSGFGTSERRLVESTWPIQAWWARSLLGAAERIFSLTIRVSGLDEAAPGPIVAMFRHASIVDNLLPAALLQHRLGYRLRWLLKRELLDVTALDVAGTRLPNHFVDRSATDPHTELRAIRRLSAHLSEDEGVLIFPEGTRFTPERQQRALTELRTRSPELADRAVGLRHTMPPRVGGVLTLLDNGYDVVVCAHEGLGGFARISDIWAGGLVGRVITIRLWRLPSSEIPAGRTERVDWLYTTWQRIDDWIEAIRTTAG